MSIKCFFGYHDYHVVGKCYTIEADDVHVWVHKYAVFECSRCRRVELEGTKNTRVVLKFDLERYEKQLRADGWISYEDLVLTKGEFL